MWIISLGALAGKAPMIMIMGAKTLQSDTIRQRIISKIGGQEPDARQLEQLKFQILGIYNRAGFINATLQWDISEPGKLVCLIDEGNQVVVRNIQVNGSKHFSTDLLRSKIIEFVQKEEEKSDFWNYDQQDIGSILNPKNPWQKKNQAVFFEHGFIPFNKSLFLRAKDFLEEFYLDNGFLEVRIFGPKKSEIIQKHWIDLQFSIEEGKQTFVEEIQFIGGGSSIKDPAIKVGDPLNLNRVEEYQTQLEESFWNQGYPRAKINAPVEGSKVIYQIDLRERVRIENIIITGNMVTRQWVIRNRLKIKVGDWYSLEKLTESRSQILQTDLFSEVDITLHGNDLWVRVKERERNTFEIGTGASLGDGPRLTGIWQYRNIFGSGISFRTRTQINYPAVFYNLPVFYPSRVSEALKSQTSNYFAGRINAGFLYPSIPIVPFNSDGTIDFNAERSLRPAYVLNRGSIVLSLLSQITKSLRVTPQLELEYGNFDCPTCAQGNPSMPLRLDQGVVKQLTPRLLLLWDRRDSALLPKKGYAVEVDMDYGFGDFDDRTISYLKFLTGFTSYVPMLNNLTWVFNFKAGGIWNVGPGSYVPLFKRFYLGGTSSVRGFADDQIFPIDAIENTLVSLGGSYITFARNEVRFPIVGNLEGGIFIDTGELLEELNHFDFSKLAVGTGFGIRYDTPIGPLMFDIGLRVFDGNRIENLDFINRFCLHFSIGNAL